MTGIGVFCAAAALAATASASAARTAPWTKERAWKWYDAQPWIRGCNYMPASAANHLELWQSYGSEERFAEVEREMALAERAGFNTMRVILAKWGFSVWYHDHDGFMRNFERTLAVFARHGIRAIVVLGNDCSRPKELWELPKLGPQSWDLGYHGGRKKSETASYPDAVGYTMLDDPVLRPKFFEMCEELVGKYAQDDRILLWNVWNEPGQSNRGEKTVVDMRELFGRLWKIDPKQPLAADLFWGDYGMGPGHANEWAWQGTPTGHKLGFLRAQKLAGELSDIISYHCYDAYAFQVRLIRELKDFYGRPLVNTEWLARCRHCNVEELYPLYYLERIGAVNWGLVAGAYQTYEPWEGMWEEVERGGGKGYDLTKWFHDLYRPSHRPYDPREIDLIRKFNRYADADFAGRRK